MTNREKRTAHPKVMVYAVKNVAKRCVRGK